MNPLTAERVSAIMIDCLHRDGEEVKNPVMSEGVMMRVGFHAERLEGYRQEVKELLAQLPDDFMQSKGGGASFLNACMTRDGEQWGEHRSIEMLLMLGNALGLSEFCIVDRQMWRLLPGGMPYFVVLDK